MGTSLYFLHDYLETGYDVGMKKFLLLLCLPLLLSACSALSGALTEKDVTQYIQAYKNIAAASGELAKLKSDNQALSLLTCGPCLERIEVAVKQAGYPDMKTFVAADIRMHLTLRAWAYVQITALAGQVGQQVAHEDFCKLKENIAASKDPQEMQRYCTQITTYTSFLDKAGTLAVKLAEKLMRAGDIDVVGKYADAIGAALTDARLPDEYQHGGGGGFDD
jgi:hypothetical protein